MKAKIISSIFVLLVCIFNSASAQALLERAHNLVDSISSVLNKNGDVIFFGGVMGIDPKKETNGGSTITIKTAETKKQIDSCVCACAYMCKSEENTIHGFKLFEVDANKITLDGETLWIRMKSGDNNSIHVQIEDALEGRKTMMWLKELIVLCGK